MRRISTVLMSLRIDASEGLLMLASAPYDEAIVEQIRALPQRHYRPESQDWGIPARRDHLRTVCGVIAELEERGIAVEIADTAAPRLAHADVGRGTLRGGAVEIAGPYSEGRLPALRALPERRFDAERKIWIVPLTRAGALAILALADDTDELVITRRARHALQRCATANQSVGHVSSASDPSPGKTRRSPTPHWRHYTSGAVFDNPSRERIDVPGIGWCVRVRVNPRGRHRSADERRQSNAPDQLAPARAQGSALPPNLEGGIEGGTA
jgi:hypothetical protein